MPDTNVSDSSLGEVLSPNLQKDTIQEIQYRKVEVNDNADAQISSLYQQCTWAILRDINNKSLRSQTQTRLISYNNIIVPPCLKYGLEKLQINFETISITLKLWWNEAKNPN